MRPRLFSRAIALSALSPRAKLFSRTPHETAGLFIVCCSNLEPYPLSECQSEPPARSAPLKQARNCARDTGARRGGRRVMREGSRLPPPGARKRCACSGLLRAARRPGAAFRRALSGRVRDRGRRRGARGCGRAAKNVGRPPASLPGVRNARLRWWSPPGDHRNRAKPPGGCGQEAAAWTSPNVAPVSRARGSGMLRHPPRARVAPARPAPPQWGRRAAATRVPAHLPNLAHDRPARLNPHLPLARAVTTVHLSPPAPSFQVSRAP